jgi:hypothetical protein
MIYGCARVSTDGQSIDDQVKQLRAPRPKRSIGKWPAGRAATMLNCNFLAKGKINAQNLAL